MPDQEPSQHASMRVPAGPLRPMLMPLCRAFEWLAMAMLVLTTVAILAEIFARGLFNMGMPGVGELARYAGLALIFLVVPLLLARDEHVRIDMFLTRAGGLPRYVIDVINEIATLAFCVFFLVSCWWFMQRASRFSTPALSMPNLYFYMPAIAGMLLTSLVALDRVLGILMGRKIVLEDATSC